MHAIDVSTGKAAMAYVGETPWHGLGSELKPGAKIETWLEAAGMDWDIEESSVRYRVGRRLDEYAGQKVLYRSDTESPLSIVSDDYKVVQPKEVMEFFRDLVGTYGMKLSTAGCLFGGTRYWALADTGRVLEVNQNDRIKGMLLLTTSCDGTMATNALFTSVRVVCNNTLQIALNSDVKERARITHRADFDADAVKRKLGVIDPQWEEFRKQMYALAKTRVKDVYAKEFVFDLFAKPRLKGDDQPYTVLRDTESVLERYRNGMGTGKTLGTLYGLVNAVTEFVDHETRARVPDHALWGSWFGRGAAIKTKAFEKALALV